MKSFWELSRLVEEMGMPPAPPGGLPGGGPMGGMGGPPPVGGGPIGGGPMGGGLGGPMGGLGGPPMGGGAVPSTPATQLKTSSVWSVWQKLLDGEPINKEKDGQEESDVIQQSPQPSQPSEPAPTDNPQQALPAQPS